MISRFHARAVQAVTGARLVAVCSRKRDRAEAFASEFECAAYESLAAMLANPAVDVLVIATPSGTHMEAAIMAAQAGKHVLCEKPLDVTLTRIDAMIAAHQQAGTRLGCTFQIRYTPALEPLRAALRDGRFGTVTYAGVTVPWWRSNEYYSESSWHGKQALDGGGALMNQAIHMIDLLCDLMPPVASVVGLTASIGHPGLETEDAAAAVVRFQGGALGVIYGSTASWPGHPKRLEISGTRGTAVFLDDHLEVFEFAEKRSEDEKIRGFRAAAGPAHGASLPAAMTHDLHAACFRDFIAALQKNVPFGIDGAAARRSVALTVAIYESSRSGRRIEWPCD